MAKSIGLLEYVVDLVLLLVCSVLRLGSSQFVATGIEKCNRPKERLIIYEFHGCPFCRKVKEACSALALEVQYYPCPKTTLKRFTSENSRFRGEAVKLGGKAQFPFLVDKNTNVSMYESDAIVNYLWKTYGDKAEKPLFYRIATNALWQWTIFVNSGLRGHRGMSRSPSQLPPNFKSLVLWGYDSSPFVNMVVERLTELEIPYVYKYAPRGASDVRKEFNERFGDMLSGIRRTAGLIQVPLLEDPNTDTVMLESRDIMNYLYQTYGAKQS